MLGGAEVAGGGPREAPCTPRPRGARERPRPRHDLRADPPPGLRRGRGEGPEGHDRGLRGQGLGARPDQGGRGAGLRPRGPRLPSHRVPHQGPAGPRRRGAPAAGAGGGHPDGMARPLPRRDAGGIRGLRARRGRHRRADRGGVHDHGVPPPHHGQERPGQNRGEGGRTAAQDLLHGGGRREALLLRVPAHRPRVHVLQVRLFPPR
mmetsp:Transcript_36345/g.108638  ORF Transcript_36345/g.108638 Transcript_36345/m.108638 type:complete len:206 (+) Transcript_36345:1060-1677(+)